MEARQRQEARRGAAIDEADSPVDGRRFQRA